MENRLKSLESIERKINKKEIENGKTEKEAAESIHDSVRYTTISDTKNFVSSYEKFKNSMEKKVIRKRNAKIISNYLIGALLNIRRFNRYLKRKMVSSSRFSFKHQKVNM